jgi:hypothetical protein
MYPEREMKRLFDRWKIEMPESISAAIKRPSSTTKDATFEKGIEQQLSKWTEVFDEEQLLKLQRVLDYFEIDVYNKQSFLPVTSIHE